MDYYLANTCVARVVEHLPEKKFDTDGSRLPEAKIYQAAADSVTLLKASGYTDDEKKIIYLYSQMNAVEEFYDRDWLDASTRAGSATIAADSQDLPGVRSRPAGTADTPLASIIGTVSTRRTSGRRSRKDTMSKLCPRNLLSRKEYKNVLSKENTVKILPGHGNMDKVVDISKGAGKTSSSRLTWISKRVEDILALPLAQSCKLEMRLPRCLCCNAEPDAGKSLSGDRAPGW